MKRTLIIIFLAGLLFSNYSDAQLFVKDSTSRDSTLPKIEFGLKIGANFRTLTGATWEQTYNAGITGGIFVGMHKNKIGVRLEILYNNSHYTSGIITDSFGNKGNFSASYIDVPLLFEYSVVRWLGIQVGPQYSNLLSAKSLNDFGGDPKVFFKAAEFSAVIGLEAKLPKHISAGARYIYGFTDLNNHVLTATDSWKNRTIQLYAGYSIR